MHFFPLSFFFFKREHITRQQQFHSVWRRVSFQIQNRSIVNFEQRRHDAASTDTTSGCCRRICRSDVFAVGKKLDYRDAFETSDNSSRPDPLSASFDARSPTPFRCRCHDDEFLFLLFISSRHHSFHSFPPPSWMPGLVVVDETERRNGCHGGSEFRWSLGN